MWRYAATRIREAAAAGIKRAAERVAERVASAGARIADVVAPPRESAPATRVAQPVVGEGGGGGLGGVGDAQPWWREAWDAPPGVSIEVVDSLPEGGSLRGPFLAASDAAEYASDIPVPTRIIRVGPLFYVVVEGSD